MKSKTTLYLTAEDQRKLNEIFSCRLLNGKKTDKSAIIAESINMLHDKERPFTEKPSTSKADLPSFGGDDEANPFIACMQVLGYSNNMEIIEEFFNTRKTKIKSEKDFTKLVGKILAQDIIEDETVLCLAGEKLTIETLKKIFNSGIDIIRTVEDVDEANQIIKMLVGRPDDAVECQGGFSKWLINIIKQNVM